MVKIATGGLLINGWKLAVLQAERILEIHRAMSAHCNQSCSVRLSSHEVCESSVLAQANHALHHRVLESHFDGPFVAEEKTNTRPCLELMD